MLLFAYLGVELADSTRRQALRRAVEGLGFGTRLVYTARCFGPDALYGFDVELGDLFEVELVARPEVSLGSLVLARDHGEPGVVALGRAVSAAVADRPIAVNLDPDFTIHTGRFDEVAFEGVAAALATHCRDGQLTRGLRVIIA
jgi:hypothetical protein